MELSRRRPVLSTEARGIKQAISEVAIDALDSHPMLQLDRTRMPSWSASILLVPGDDEVVDCAHLTALVTSASAPPATRSSAVALDLTSAPLAARGRTTPRPQPAIALALRHHAGRRLPWRTSERPDQVRSEPTRTIGFAREEASDNHGAQDRFDLADGARLMIALARFRRPRADVRSIRVSSATSGRVRPGRALGRSRRSWTRAWEAERKRRPATSASGTPAWRWSRRRRRRPGRAARRSPQRVTW